MKLRKENILIVDDNYDMLELLQRHLKSFNFHTYKASSVVEAIEVLKTTPINLLITDLQMPEINGIELIKYTSEHFPSIPKLVITGFPSVDTAINAVKSGALDYLIKPFTGEELKKAIQNCLKNNDLKPNQPIERKNLKETFYSGIVGSSEEHYKLIDVIERVKDNRVTVLIEGESGTGKELIARAIHYNGRFASQPFITVNCGGIPESLLESELFGYVKGAFTGATETRAGFFQTADGGTIFLDEISNTSLAMQAKLLRVLQEKEFYMVGSKKPIKVNIRIVAATNVDLMQLVKKGLFREDLYYRLNIITIDLPPLRERGDDIVELLDFFLKKYLRELGKGAMHFSKKALQSLHDYSWPGNVRELQNLVHRLVIMADEDTIDTPDLPESFRYSATRARGLNRKLAEVEKDYISDVLAAHKNNISQAALILGIDRKTLREKLKKKSG